MLVVLILPAVSARALVTCQNSAAVSYDKQIDASRVILGTDVTCQKSLFKQVFVCSTGMRSART